MLRYVPVVFDAYRTLKAHLRWTLQNLVGFADEAGRCFPSVRKLAEVADISKSTVSRHLAELAKAGVITRERRPGGVFRYRIDPRFLPASRVSHPRKAGVPRARTEEQPTNNRSDSALPDYGAQWQARVRHWQKSRFWLPQWGPKPNERGCLAPVR